MGLLNNFSTKFQHKVEQYDVSISTGTELVISIVNILLHYLGLKGKYVYNLE